MYQPIESYGLIGNMRTVALVGRNGSIDWYCFPRFDSPSVFGALLDDARGGRFQLAPVEPGAAVKQLYWPATNVLVTRFLSAEGVAELQDFMPAGPALDGWHDHLVRRVRAVRGTVRFRLVCEPAFDYGRAAHTTALEPWGAGFYSPGLDLALASEVPLRRSGNGVAAELAVEAGSSVTFVLRPREQGRALPGPPGCDEAEALFQGTVAFWRTWLSRCNYHGRWREMVERSALALKLLTYEPTGAIVAAPTCSLPEQLGGTRNWDYRYTWIRDAAFTLYGLMRIGFTGEAAGFMRWLEARFRDAEPGEGLQIVYGIDGRRDLEEVTLGHLEGYRGSRPVRVGNGAHKQLQLDIYGELLDSVYLYNKYGSPISSDAWMKLRGLLRYVESHWDRPDEGIWEVRGGRRHFVYSKLMCWVALDRGLRLADKRSFPADRGAWMAARDAIYESILARGWSEDLQTFVQSYGSTSLDASNLLMPLVFFMAPNDSRMLKTIERTLRTPAQGGLVSDGLVHRYDPERSPDGLCGTEGTFNLCTFWLVEAMTRAGRVDRKLLDEARLIFERMLGYANHLGLYAEQIGPAGEALGNFPQAFTHLALISAAFNLDRALGAER